MQRRAARGLNPVPPEMKQASLVKNAVSIRRDTAKATSDLDVSGAIATINDDDLVVLSFTFDATKP